MTLGIFRGGIHPPDKKEFSKDRAISVCSAPARVVIPLSQHIGTSGKAVVKIGQPVKKGELIGAAESFVSASVHSSVSGIVSAIGEFPLASGRMALSVVIENDMQEEWAGLQDNPDYKKLSVEELREKVKQAGIVGMGGAAFPAHIKLSPPKEKPIDAVVLNGAECEPYLTADYRIMIERTSDVIAGLKVMMKMLGAVRGYIGIENNKPDAVDIMRNAVGSDNSIAVLALEVKYPQGAEKMLIKSVTGREVPPRGLPMDVGVVVHNVGTAVAVYEAARYGKPLIERVVTVTGESIKEPKNLLVKVGTLISDVIEECGGLASDTAKVISGGPMMGCALSGLDVPVTKGTSGVLAIPEQPIIHYEHFGPCIRCGRCIDVCPMGLMPSMLSIMSKKGLYEEAKEYNLFDCFECGSCTYVCPAKRPIVQLIRLAKSLVKP